MNGLSSVMSSSWRGWWIHRNWDRFRERRPGPRPRLLVDVSVIMRHDAKTGIQRVVRAVWTNLLERSPSMFDVVPVFATARHGYRYARPDFLTRPPSERHPGKTVCVQPGDKFLGLDLNAHLMPSYQRQISSWRAHGVTTHLLVYDLLPLHRPHWFNGKTVRNFGRWMEMVRHHCDQALCISDHVANELRAHLGESATGPAIGRIYMAGDIEGSHPSRGLDASISNVISIASRLPTILMVGTIEPRKGHDVALAAFDHLWKEFGDRAPALVLVGKPGWRTEALQELIRNHPEQHRRLFWLLDVSDEGLAQLYEACSGVLVASRAEGFGLPLIEAAMHRRHVLARDLAVFREQRLPNVSYFQDEAPAALTGRLLALATAPPAPVADLPTWSDCVDGLLGEIGLGTNEVQQAAHQLRQAS